MNEYGVPERIPSRTDNNMTAPKPAVDTKITSVARESLISKDKEGRQKTGPGWNTKRPKAGK